MYVFEMKLKPKRLELPLKMIFCDVCGTPVTSVRASERSFTTGPVSSWALSVMLCFIDPDIKLIISIKAPRIDDHSIVTGP